jgi:tetratricopeptide (TPR) repeat protein
VILVLGWLTWRQSHVYQRSENLWTHTLARYPDDPTSLGKLAELRVLQSRLNEAEGLYRHAIRSNPQDWQFYFGLAEALYRQGRQGEARSFCDLALKYSGDQAYVLISMAEIERSGGDIDEAQKLLHRALKAGVRKPTALSALGAIRLGLGDEAGAESYLNQALEVNREYGPAHAHLAVLRQRHRKLIDAREHADKAVLYSPWIPEMHLVRARVLADDDDAEEAQREFMETLRLRPGWGEAARDFAWMLLTTDNDAVRDPDRARAYARIAKAGMSGPDDGLRELLARLGE